MGDEASALNVTNADDVCAVFAAAAAAYRGSSLRMGCVDHLPPYGRCTFTGDLHDHRENFTKILTVAKLERDAGNHLVVQEITHPDRLINGMDLSYRSLVRAAELKQRYPKQVHHVLSNHELAQARGEKIMKAGGSQIEAFANGLDYVFGDGAEEVQKAIADYIRALPLAVRTASGILCAHSLPSPRMLERFDKALLLREMNEADITGPSGSAYLMIWGRNLNEELARTLGGIWDVQVFVLGHQHADMGYEEIGDSIVVINSDHNHAMALPVDLSKTYTRDQLLDALIPLASIIV
ncbi:MAG: hypothetical protein GC162_06200 [Planctomycetes bacterium]|nr:hypothetical protein [Planctomycetota bacterium]